MPTKTKAPKPYPTFRKRKEAVEAGAAWLAAKEASDAAAHSLKVARARLTAALSIEQVETEYAIIAYQDGEMISAKTATLDVGDRQILVQKQSRREFDVETLDDSLSDSVFAQVTKTVVNAEAFDSAVILGLIDEDVIEEAVTTMDVLLMREVVKP